MFLFLFAPSGNVLPITILLFGLWESHWFDNLGIQLTYMADAADNYVFWVLAYLFCPSLIDVYQYLTK